MKYLVFYDIDGVLTSNRVYYATNNPNEGTWKKFDPVAIDFFNRIDRTYEDVSFVCMSTWKNWLPTDLHSNHVFKAMMINAGFRGKHAEKWKTNYDDEMEFFNKDRAYQVLEYINSLEKKPEDYILFDDNRYNFNSVLGKKRLVWTDPEEGMLYKHMKNASAIMGTWKKR